MGLYNATVYARCTAAVAWLCALNTLILPRKLFAHSPSPSRTPLSSFNPSPIFLQHPTCSTPCQCLYVRRSSPQALPSLFTDHLHAYPILNQSVLVPLPPHMPPSVAIGSAAWGNGGAGFKSLLVIALDLVARPASRISPFLRNVSAPPPISVRPPLQLPESALWLTFWRR